MVAFDPLQCPHDFACPLSEGSKRPCHFAQRVQLALCEVQMCVCVVSTCESVSVCVRVYAWACGCACVGVCEHLCTS